MVRSCFPRFTWALIVLLYSTTCLVAQEEETTPFVVFEPPSGTFTERHAITLSASEPEGIIYYTLDGSVPGKDNGIRYTAPIELESTTAVRAGAVLESGRLSAPSTAYYLHISEELAEYRSRLPIVIIDSLGEGPLPAKGFNQMGTGLQQMPRKLSAYLIFNPQPELENVPQLRQLPQIAERVGIRQRGSFSATWKQMAYSVEFWDEAEEEKKVSPLGLPKHSDWVMYYPDSDHDLTLIYNAFMWRLSAKAGRYAPRFRWAEVFVNEDGGQLDMHHRRGVYAIVEKVSRGKERLVFDKLSDDGTTGGWQLSINRVDAIPAEGWPAPNGATQPQFFHTAGPDRVLETPPNEFGRGDDIPSLDRAQLNFENPNGYKINTTQRAAIEAWFKEFESVLYDDEKWMHPTEGYRKYIDPVDFADFFLLNNLAQNYDGLLLSIYPWRSSDDGLLRIGPTWDFNYGCYDQSGSPTGNPLNQREGLWYGRLFNDPAFLQLYHERWQTLRQGPLSNESLSEVISELAEEIGEENAVAQGIPSAEIWRSRLSTMESWLHQRANWLDRQAPALPQFSLEDGASVDPGTPLRLSATHGIIVFTTDGEDPLNGSQVNQSARTIHPPIEREILSLGAPARVIVPTDNKLGDTWFAPEFDDEAWTLGASGVGYDQATTYRRLINLDLGSIENTSIYVRIPFELEEDPASFISLTLKMAYDDGFVAYLNGVRVASERALENLDWNASATSNNSDQVAMNPPLIVLSDAQRKLLRKGTNVLAIHGLNDELTSSDLLVAPTLIAGEARPNQTDTLTLTEDTTVIARTLLNGQWGPAVQVTIKVKE